MARCFLRNAGSHILFTGQSGNRRTVNPGGLKRHLCAQMSFRIWAVVTSLGVREKYPLALWGRKKVSNTFLYQVFPDFRRALRFGRFPGFAHLSVLLVTAACKWRWVWSDGGMVLTGEMWSTGRKTLYSVGGRWMNGYGAMVEWYWQGKCEVLREKHYIAWVVGEWMGMGQWWNGTDRGTVKYWEKNVI